MPDINEAVKLKSSPNESIHSQASLRGVTVFVLDNKVSSGFSSTLSAADLPRMKGLSFEAKKIAIRQGFSVLQTALEIELKAHPENDFVLLNSGLQIDSTDWLSVWQNRLAQDETLGIIAGKIFDHRGLIYSNGRSLISPFGLHEHLVNLGHGESDSEAQQTFHEVDAVLPWFCYIRKEAFLAAGGFDPKFAAISQDSNRPSFVESDDFCLAVRAAGFSIAVDPVVKATASFASLHPKFQALYENKPGSSHSVWDSRIINLWKKKWRWHPSHPNPISIRERWSKTKICWQIGEQLLDSLNEAQPQVDLLLVTRNNLSLFKKTLQSLGQTDYPHFSLAVFLNGSIDGTKDYLKEIESSLSFPLYIHESPVNLGYVPAFNWLLHQSKAPRVAKIDDDIEVDPDWLRQLVDCLRQRPYAGAVGAKIVHASAPQFIQWADYRALPTLTHHDGEVDQGQFNYISPTVANMGCCLLYRRSAIEKIGPLDISLNAISWDDLDHQIGLWNAGYEVFYHGLVTVKHASKPLRDLCRRSMKNNCGNGYKVKIKWGPDALALIDMSLDVVRINK